jgi:hypothetical protein
VCMAWCGGAYSFMSYTPASALLVWPSASTCRSSSTIVIIWRGCRRATHMQCPLLLLVCLLACVAILPSVARVARSATRHARLQKALLHENVIQQLSKPHQVPRQATKTVHTKLVLLRGYGGAHWAALKWVNRLIENEGKLFSELAGLEAARREAFQTKCGAACCPLQHASHAGPPCAGPSC